VLFNSFEFGGFFLVVFAVYLVLPHRWQNRMLLVASYVFYGAWDWRFLSLIFLSTCLDFWVGRRLGATDDPKRRKRYLALSLFGNFSALGFFKYFDFFVENFVHLMQSVGISLSAPSLHIILPVGISFYTFQTVSYSIDVYRRQLEPTRRFEDFALFVAFFPSSSRAQSSAPAICLGRFPASGRSRSRLSMKAPT